MWPRRRDWARKELDRGSGVSRLKRRDKRLGRSARRRGVRVASGRRALRRPTGARACAASSGVGFQCVVEVVVEAPGAEASYPQEGERRRLIARCRMGRALLDRVADCAAPGRSAGQDASVSESLEGTVALVTGASSGIGEATAIELAAHGARVVIVARRRDRLVELAKRLETDGAETAVVEADITDEAAARGAVEQALAQFGRLDTVVANAGVMLLGPIENAPMQEWQRMVDT